MPASAQERSAAPSTVVRQVDHILIASNQPAELFAFLSETLQLPVAWPLASHGGFVSGGMAAGNVNLEVLARRMSPDDAARAAIVGLALEPVALAQALPELAGRGIPHGRPAPFRGRLPDGAYGTRWTTVALPNVSSDGLEVFLCEYRHDVPAQRQQLNETLRARGGGPLVVRSVHEIVCGMRDPGGSARQWQILLQPTIPIESTWRIGAGPAIRLQPAASDAVAGLVIAVSSLEQARRFLREQALLHTEQPGAIILTDPRLQGLNLTLVARPGGDE